jgi:hypothetical protein
MLRFTIAAGILLIATDATAAEPVGAALALRAGAAKVDITPPASALQHGDIIRDPLYVRAIVISNGTTCAALVGVEQGNFETPIFDDAAQRASRSTGCPTSNIIISATHTHTGNTGGLNNSGSPTPRQVGDAMVTAIEQANARLKPARIGYGTTQVNLNVNRDLFEGGTWYQGNNREGHSDKTLAVVELLGEDDLPIGVYMNYAMHPINFYLSGTIGADFPGEASRYIERRFPTAVAVFTQGASGNQNPLLDRPFNKLASVRTRMADAQDDRLTSPDGWKVAAGLTNANVVQTEQMSKPITAAESAVYKAALAQAGELVMAEGTLIAESAIDVMKNLTPHISATARIWSARDEFTCPGRDRLDTTARQGTLPPYKDGVPVNLRIGLLRIGEIDFASVNGEVYSEISARLKKEAPSSKLMMVTIANGRANSGYIYSNESSHHLTFQVIGSRLKPGCAEDGIVNGVLGLYRQAAN